MAKSLAQIQAAIKKLKQEAATVRQREVSGVVARIKEAIAHYGLTAKDLGLSTRSSPAGNGKTSRKAATRMRRSGTGVVKYRDEAGNTWTGHGRRPKWFTNALSSGRTEADLRA